MQVSLSMSFDKRLQPLGLAVAAIHLPGVNSQREARGCVPHLGHHVRGRLADGEQQRLDFPGLLDRARREEQDNSSAKVHARRVCGRDERASRCAR